MPTGPRGPGSCPQGPPGLGGPPPGAGYSEKPVTIKSQTVEGGRPTLATADGTLYVDRTQNEIGIKIRDGRVSVPINDVLDLLRREVL
jgi:hypothetical protein